MNLKSLSAIELVEKTKEAVKTEKLSTILVLKHLREIESRKLYLKYGYPSLFEMATRHFGYCAGAAQRRISAMRLIREIPLAEEKIKKGELSLTNASQLQTFFRYERKEPYSKVEKLNLMTECLNQSSRHVEKKLIGLKPEADRRDDIRMTDTDRLRLSITVSEELFQRLEKLKYQYRLSSIEDVISMLSESFDRKVEKVNSLPAPEVKRHIRATTKRIVIRENKNQGCVYRDPVTKEKCQEKVNLQFDHIHPHSQGGPSIAENLRLLCGPHNLHVWHHEQKKNEPR